MTACPCTKEIIPVVGGSAAGFFTAYLLARHGLPVGVFEQAERLVPFPRTLIVTHRLRDLLGPLGETCIVNEIRRFELFTDGRSATIHLQQPDLIIERAKLICELARQAQSCGAELRLGWRFLHVRGSNGGLALTFERPRGGAAAEVHSRTMVGADGVLSRVAEAAGWPRQQTVPLVQAIVRLPGDLASDTVRVWLVPEDTPYFYWLIPESSTRGVLGLIGEDGKETRRRLQAFLKRRRLVAERFQGARIPLYTGWVPAHRQVGGGRVYLAGDAAAQVKVTTVGGIVTGLRGAFGVAEAILNGGSSRELRRLRRELDLHLLIRRALDSFQQPQYERLFDLLNGAARNSLGAHDRDAVGQILWRLCVNQPRLWLLGIRGLLTGSSFLRRNPLPGSAPSR